MKIIRKLEVDLAAPLCTPRIDVVQEDTVRAIEVTFLHNGEAWNIPSGTAVSVAYCKRDGTSGRYDKLPDNSVACTWNKNVVTATLAPQVLSIDGPVKLSLIVQDSTTLDQVATFPLNLNVIFNPAASQNVSNHYFNYQTLERINSGLSAATARTNNVGHYVSFDDVVLELDTTTNEITLHPGFICMRTWRKQFSAPVIVKRDTSGGLSYLVYDTADSTVKSVPGSSFSDNQVLLAILSRDKPLNENANFIPGIWSVDGTLAPASAGFSELPQEVSLVKSRASNIGQFICFSDTVFDLDTATNKIIVNPGFLYTYGGRRQINAAEVTRDTVGAVSLLVYDTVNKTVRSINPDNLSSNHSIIAVLSRDNPTNENSNRVPGLWSVDGVVYPGKIKTDKTFLNSGDAADSAAVGEAVQSIKTYMYGAEKLVHFIAASPTVLDVNTAANTITVNKGFLFYKSNMIETVPTTVNILSDTSVNVIVYNSATEPKIQNIRIREFDASKMYLLAILWKGYFNNYSANDVPGLWSVDGVIVSGSSGQVRSRDTVWVSTDGSDSNTGEAGSRYRTINKAIASGAKTIFVYAGTYREAINVSNSGGELEILAKPIYDDKGELKKDVIIDLGKELVLLADSNLNLVRVAYPSTSADFIYRAFVSKEEHLVYSEATNGDTFLSTGYSCNLWSGDTKLIPVLSLEDCQKTPGTWFYDGETVYANAAAGTFTLNDGSAQYGMYFEYMGKVKLMGITVKHARADAVRLKGCTDSEVSRCVFGYSGLYNGLAFENSSGVVRNCEAKFVRTDGFNIHGVGTVDFIDCVSHDNGDDGISHHDESGGIVLGGEYYNNVKGGVCSPTFGSRNEINGVYTHHNGMGVCAVTKVDGEYPECNVCNCVIENNTVGIQSDRYTLRSWNNVLSANGEDTKVMNGGRLIFWDSSDSSSGGNLDSDVPAGGGGGDEWELITDITTTEEVAGGIVITQNDNGISLSELKYTEIWYMAKMVGVSSNTHHWWEVAICTDAQVKCTLASSGGTTARRYVHLYAFLRGGKLYFSNTNTNPFGISGGSDNWLHNYLDYNISTYIASLTISANPNAVVGVDSEIRILGRRGH